MGRRLRLAEPARIRRLEFMRREINARPGKITLIAVGELTNIAALLEAEPGIGRRSARSR